MATDDSVTPYAEAVAMLQQGLPMSTVEARLQARGLDAQEVALLLASAKRRAPDAGAPVAAEWGAVSDARPEGGWPVEAPVADAPVPPPETPVAPGVCTRCGTFVAAADQRLVLQQVYCLACAERPDVNYPKAFRDAHWGRRDGWAWWFGGLGVLTLIAAAVGFLQGLAPIFAAVNGVVMMTFWAGWAPARLLMMLMMLISLVLMLAGVSAPEIVSVGFVIAAFRSTRNQLFFQIEPGEEKLAAAWRAAHDNRPAVWSRAVALVSLCWCATWVSLPAFAWGTVALGLLAVGLGALGLSRVNPQASPPVGQRTAALIGVVLGGLTVVGAGVFLVAMKVG